MSVTSPVEIISFDNDLRKAVNEIRNFGYDRIIFTNGCFDILHPGHLGVLRFAWEQAGPRGGVVVGLNSDSSIRKIKGPERPIMDEDARAQILISLRYVDHVITFDEETPIKLIELLRPDIIVKGADYEASRVVGNDLALVMLAPVEEKWSTTKIIEKITK